MNGGHYTAFVKCNDELNLSSGPSMPTITTNASSVLAAPVSAPYSGRLLDVLSRSLKLNANECCELEMSETMASSPAMFSPLSPFSGGTTGTGGSGGSNPNGTSSSSHSASANTNTTGDMGEENGRWVLFDDEIVHDVPPDRLHQFIVTGILIYSSCF
jgi:hypothetical protein